MSIISIGWNRIWHYISPMHNPSCLLAIYRVFVAGHGAPCPYMTHVVSGFKKLLFHTTLHPLPASLVPHK